MTPAERPRRNRVDKLGPVVLALLLPHRLYWEGDPVDNYAKAIRRINKHACYVKDPGVFYFGRKEVSKTDLANAIMDSTDLSLQDWLFSIRRRQYDRDDFIPALHPDACPKNVLNIFDDT